MAALLLMTILKACASAEIETPTGGRELPPAPSVMGPIEEPKFAKGQDAKDALAVCMGAVKHRDRRALGSLRWYNNLVSELRKPIRLDR